MTESRRSTPERGSVLLLIIGLLLTTMTASPARATHGGLHVTDLADTSLDATDLAESIVGSGVAVDPTSVQFTGDHRAGGAFSGGTGIIGFEDGIVLGSGEAVDVVGPNQDPATTTEFGTPGDDDLTTLAGVTTDDAAILEFEFEVGADAEQVSFNYVFGSEEYNEFVGSQFNDVFAFWVNDENCAVVGDPPAPVSINTINNGQPGVDPTNPDLYINNDPFGPDSTGTTVPTGELLDTETDGLTVVLQCEAGVDPGTNTLRLAIADGSDSRLDSWVFIESGSLTSGPVVGSVAGTVTDAETGEPIVGATVTADSASTTTGADGTYLFDDLDPGGYTVAADADGYQPASQQATVAADETTTVDFALQPDPTAEGACVDLIAGGGGDNGTVAGEVCVENDGDDLFVTYTTIEGWMLTETHLHVADDAAGLPRNKKGNPRVGHFDHAANHQPAAPGFTYTIALATLGAETGDALVLAAHAEVERVEGAEIRVESAWGDGDRFVEPGNWAMHFGYEVR